ncbi:hypothetical protein BaRGS_00001028 [Batillaria attramentaria]|uniref:Fatty acid synthase n=1 Tax=Batillaria attramentaria TaxID=370345 RepID=A0ABD0M998_9CAEN
MGCAHSCVRWSSNVDSQVSPLFESSLLRLSSRERQLEGFEQETASADGNVIAIVGIGCRTPGADNIKQFWQLLVNGECHLTEVPANRWNASAFLDPDPAAPCKAFVQRGGFMEDPYGFDNSLYGINDFEAASMDPQQCLLLECTTMALLDAGITRAQLSGSNTGVFIGSMNSDSQEVLPAHSSTIDNYTASSISTSILSGRLSYVFNLLGPCMVIDTACSSSLVAIHQARVAILNGDCDMAICGGVNSMTNPDMFIQLTKARMLSPTGVCRAFSDKADGYTRGEGCGVIILKRLKDAVRDGDKIWATLYTGTNQDGHTVSPMTAPSGGQQKKLLQSVYHRFGINVDKVDYVEAHGTGTAAGDPVEVNALGEFFSETSKPRDRYIGSVKTNIGHTESAAGILGLIKVVLMIDNEVIVPSLHCDTVNPKIDLAKLKFSIPKEPIQWSRPDKIAACNSFGFGGSNCHAVVMASKQSPVDENRRRKSCIVCFSASTRKSLVASMEDIQSDEEVEGLNVLDVAYTSTVRRDHYPYRVAFVVEDMQDLLSAVNDKLTTDIPAPQLEQPGVVFVFCGMGTAWQGMCTELMRDSTVFRNTMEELDKILSFHVEWSLIKRLQNEEDPTKDPLLGPIAIFACQVALAAVWQSLGIKPSCVLGQSVGEVAAAYTAGCLSLADAVKVIYRRTELLAQVTGGSMVIVQHVGVEEVRKALKGLREKASISLEYSPTSCAVSADATSMASVKHHLTTKLKPHHATMHLIDLNVAVAYHSEHVNPCAEKLEAALTTLPATAPKSAFISSVTGSAVKSPVDAKYWVDNMRKPVLFSSAVKCATEGRKPSNTILLEIGPKPVLRAHLKDLFPGEQWTSLASLSKQPEMKMFHQAVVTLYERGVDLHWKNLQTEGRKITDIPRYVFDKKYLRGISEADLLLKSGCDLYHKKHLYAFPIRDTRTSFKLLLSPLTIPSIYDHIISGKVVVPGVFYAETGFAIASYIGTSPSVAVSVKFEQALSVKKEEVVNFDVYFESNQENPQFWQSPLVVKKDGRRLATIQLTQIQPGRPETVSIEGIRSRCQEKVSKNRIYAGLRRSGFQYGQSFLLLEDGYSGSSECLVPLKLNDVVLKEMHGTTIHPSILDSLLQSSQVIVDKRGSSVGDVLPKSLGKLVVHRAMEPVMLIHTRSKSMTSKTFVYDSRLLSLNGDVIGELDDFVVQALAPQDEILSLPMLTTEWKKVLPMLQEKDLSVSEIQIDGQIFITGSDLKNGSKGHTIVRYDSNAELSTLSGDISKALTSNGKTTSVLLVYSGERVENEDGTQVQLHIVNMCCLIQTVLNTLNELSLTIPFYFCTFNAWPSATEDGVQHTVSPAATALWGLLRTVLQECVYPHITAVEMHLPLETMKRDSIWTIFAHLMSRQEVLDYPEVMLTTEGLYVNQVLQAPPHALDSPTRSDRATSGTQLGPNTVILSTDPFKVSDLLAIQPQENVKQANGQAVKIKVDAIAQPSENLMQMKVSSHCMFPERTDSPNAYVVMALEVVGKATSGQAKDVASVFPVPAGAEVTVPVETVLPAAGIPDYQAGDASKLVLTWDLLSHISSQHVTVLSGSNSNDFATLQKIVLTSFDERSNNDVNIVSFEDLPNTLVLMETVLSLVYIDSQVMTVIAKNWKTPQRLVTCGSLISQEALSYMHCSLPEVEICLLETQEVFQPVLLKKTVPKIRQWIDSNRKLMPEVTKALHAAENVTCREDSKNAFQFKALKLENLRVKEERQWLFRNDSIYIVVGGLTGLGWICVEFMAQNHAGCIAIINRRAASPEQTAQMEKLGRTKSCCIQAFQADIASLQSVSDVLKQIANKLPQYQLRGVFTGAAVVEDGFFPNMQRSAFEKVLSPKVKGAWNLHQLTKKQHLDYFVMHSSAAAYLGNLGQANYGAGNAFLDGLAHYRRQQGLAGQTINWGPLNTGLLDDQDEIRQRLEAMGFPVATRQEITETLGTILRFNWTQSAPIKIIPELYGKRIHGTGVRSLAMRLEKLISSPPGHDSQTPDVLESIGKIKLLEPAERQQAYETYVRDLASRVLSMEAGRITQDASLLELGLDSVTGMMMISQIQRDTSYKIAAMDVLSAEATVVSVAKTLSEYQS